MCCVLSVVIVFLCSVVSCAKPFFATSMHNLYVPFLGKPSKFLFHRFLAEPKYIKIHRLIYAHGHDSFLCYSMLWLLMGNHDRNAQDGTIAIFGAIWIVQAVTNKKITSNRAKKKGKERERERKGESNKFGWAKQTQLHRRQLKVVSVIVVTRVVLLLLLLLQFQCIFSQQQLLRCN